MIRIYGTGFRPSGFPLFAVAAIIVVFSIFFWGFTKAIELLLPVLVLSAYALIVIFVFGILPLSISKTNRLKMAATSLGMANILGAITWTVSFFYVVKVFGFLGIILAFLLQLLAPIALAGALLKGSWAIARDLSLWIAFGLGMKIFSQWLLSLMPNRPAQKEIIDIEAEEVEG